MKTVLSILMFFSIGLSISAHGTEATPESPRTERFCWEIFGSEVICLTISIDGVQIPGNGELKLGAEYGSRGDYINLKFPPTIRTGSFTVKETVRFNLCNAGIKTIKGGTKVNIRNGEARLDLH